MKKLILFTTGLIMSTMFLFAGTLPQIISSDTTITSTEICLLDGKTFVTNGATLTILAGTRIEGIYKSVATEASALIITRGSKIMAEGDADNPIVFTAHLDDTNTSYNTGDWGGLVILGYAPTNQTDPYIEGIYPPYVPAGVDCYFGGDECCDNSGTLTYVRVEYAGASILADNELNAFTFGGVGCGTTLDHLEAYKGADDGFEFFGGTVCGKYLLAVSNNDDQFDFDFGYSGCLQFLAAVLDPDVEYGSHTNGIESDNDGDGSSLTPLTRPVISNLTIAALGTPTTGTWLYGARWRRNSRFVLFNSIIYGFPTSIRVESTEGINAVRGCATAGCDTFSYYCCNAFEKGTCYEGFPSPYEPDSCLALSNFSLTGPSTYDSIFNYEGLKPVTDSYVASGFCSNFSCCACESSSCACDFSFESVDYKGAVDPSGDYWLDDSWIIFEDEESESSLKSAQGTLGLTETVSNEFNLLPNPANESVKVTFSEAAGNASVSILSISGQVVLPEKTVEKGSTEISLSLENIETGVYFVVYRNNGIQTSKRFIKN